MNRENLLNASRLIVKGNLTDRVVAASVLWEEHISKLSVFYFVEGVVSDDEEELCELTLAEILAEFPDVKLAASQCLCSGASLGELRQLDGLIYVCDQSPRQSTR